MIDKQTQDLVKARIQEDLNAQLSRGTVSNDDVKQTVLESIKRFCGKYPIEDQNAFGKVLIDDFLGFGPLQPLIDDENISEIMVNGGGRNPETGEYGKPQTFVEIQGVVHRADNVVFESEQHLMRVISRIGQLAGRTCDEANPCMDAQLPDGSRVNAVHHSISIDGQSLNIRKFKRDVKTPKEIVGFGTCSPVMMRFLASCVRARLNIIVSGGTGSGKTTMLNVLSMFIPDSERVVTIEDTAELQLTQPNLVRMQARPANAEGEGQVTVHDLVVNALRMRPDRIVVGECRSDETIEMLQAMQTGHDGSLTTIHANSAVSVFNRIETMVMGSQTLNVESVDKQIAEAVDLIVHTERLKTGQRVIKQIMSVDKYADGVISHSDIFTAQANVDGSVTFLSDGRQPLDIRDRILAAGAPYDPNWFLS